MPKTFYYIGFFVCLSGICLLTAFSGKYNVEVNRPSAKSDSGAVLLEFFTSQGCSSCPPADEIAGIYAVRNDPHIIPIVFHVDYWNRLGWIDPFSNGSFSERQSDYSENFSLGSVYTPQLVMNGREQLVGSDHQKIKEGIGRMLRQPMYGEIKITGIEASGGNVQVTYTVDRWLPGSTINAALVQKKSATYIKAGENRGMKLDNFNIVRDLKSKPVDGNSGKLRLDKPVGYTGEDYIVVLFLQEKRTGPIEGLAEKDCGR